jgi:MFS family permease
VTTSSTFNAVRPAAESGRQATPERLVSRQFVLLLALLVAFGFSFSVFLLLPKYLAVEHHAGARTIGAISAAAMLSGVLCVPLIGIWIDRYPRRPLVVVSALAMGVASAGFALVDAVGTSIVFLRLVQGVAFTMLFNAVATLVTDLASPQRLGQALGLFGVAMLSTNAIAPMVAEPLADWAGWAPVFVLAGLSGAVAAGLGLSIREQRDATPQSQSPVRGLLSPRKLFVLGIAAVVGAALGTMFTFTQPFALGQGITRLSDFFLGYTVAALVVRLGFGNVADRLGRQRVSVAALLLYGAVVAATAALRPGTLGLLGALFGIAHGVFYPAMTALAVQGVPRAQRGSTLTYFNGAFNAGVGVSVAAFGLVADAYGYPFVFIATGILTLAAAVGLSRVPAE